MLRTPSAVWRKTTFEPGYRPDLPRDLAQVAAAVRTADRLWGDRPTRRAPALCAALWSTAAEQNAPVGLQPFVATTLWRHLNTTGGPVPTLADVHHNVGVAFDRARADGKLVDVVDREVRAGVDARRLQDVVVRLESLKHIGLVLRLANRMARSRPDADNGDELAGFGFAGLLRALPKYDRDEAMFSTYATYRITGAIRDGLRSEAYAPRRQTAKMKRIRDKEDELVQELGRHVSLAEAADAAGVSLRQLRELQPLMHTHASVDELTDPDRNGDGGDAGHAQLTVEDDPADQVCDQLLASRATELLDHLPDAEADAIRMLVLDGLTFAEASRRSGLTPGRLRSRKRRGLDALREQLGA